MSARTSDPEADAPRGPPPLWRPAGLAFLLVSLAAVTAGAFPEWFVPPHVSRSLPVPPALSILLAAQAGFILIFCTLLLAPRADRSLPRYLAGTIGEYALWVVASVPFYVTAAWLADADGGDVVRSVAYLTAVALGAWGLGLLFNTGRTWAACAAALVALLGAIAAPVAHYLMVEFADAPARLAWLWRVGPVTNAYALARPAASWLPQPSWSWLLWPVIGALAALVAALAPSPPPRA